MQVMKIGLVFLVFGLINLEGVYAKKKPQIEIVSENLSAKEVIGKLISRRPVNNPKYIGIVIMDDMGEDTDYDMLFYVDKNITVEHKRKLSDLNKGDTVKIIYDEVTQITEDGRKFIIKTAKSITFISSERKSLRSGKK